MASARPVAMASAGPVPMATPAGVPAAGAGGAVGWWRTAEPLRYAPHVRDGMHLLAHDPAGPGRIVEVLGDLSRATSVAVVVPGNAHNLGNYRTATGGASPRHNGHRLQQALQQIAPSSDTAVVVWLGYRCPRGFVTGARRRHALRGAMDLRRLIAHLPAGARITLAGHSYGSLLCALAASDGRVEDVIALASPGMGVRHADEVGARVWAARAPDDWVRFAPRVRVAGFGHGPHPTDPGFGARIFACDGAVGHSGYYAAGTECLRNIARIVLGRSAEVTPADMPSWVAVGHPGML